jgi:hypothetical protein
MNVKERIAAAKAEIESVEPLTVDVEFGGEVTTLGFRPIPGTDWADLTAAHPPRKGSVLDGNIGYNLNGVLAHFPASHVTVDGEPTTDEEYADIVSVLASPHIQRASEVLFHIQQLAPAQRLISLGKASAGAQRKKPRSPAK